MTNPTLRQLDLLNQLTLTIIAKSFLLGTVDDSGPEEHSAARNDFHTEPQTSHLWRSYVHTCINLLMRSNLIFFENGKILTRRVQATKD